MPDPALAEVPPVKRLYLLRHAKARRGEIPDIERPLAGRGRKDARLVAGWMRKKGLRPELVLCSPARRTLETWEALCERLGAESKVRTLKSLYNASPATLLARIRAAPDPVTAVLVVGHNPGLENLARALAAKNSNSRALAALAKKLPAGALAVFEADVPNWRELAEGNATLVRLVRPKQLA